jgi:hypothetical protein
VELAPNKYAVTQKIKIRQSSLFHITTLPLTLLLHHSALSYSAVYVMWQSTCQESPPYVLLMWQHCSEGIAVLFRTHNALLPAQETWRKLGCSNNTLKDVSSFGTRDRQTVANAAVLIFVSLLCHLPFSHCRLPFPCTYCGKFMWLVL